jgi:hypothetical protein
MGQSEASKCLLGKSKRPAIMPHDLVSKIPCDASKMIQLSKKRQVKGLRKKHAQIEKALKAVGTSFSTTSRSESKRKIYSARVQVES